MKRLVAPALLLLVAWIVGDLWAPFQSDLRRFDAAAIARWETQMWRAYYDRRPIALYLSLAQMLRTQQGFPFLRAHLNAYRAARAALLFKDGRTRAEYERALPDLEAYFAAICRLGRLPSSPRQLAALELEWWIVHRKEGTHAPRKLAFAIARAAGALYDVSPGALISYATLRAEAMRRRDEKAYGSGMLEDDWRALETMLVDAYGALLVALHPGERI